MRNWKDKINNEHLKKFVNNRYAFTITSMLIISFIVLVMSHMLNNYKLKTYEAYLKELNTRSVIVFLDGEKIGEVRNIKIIDNVLNKVKNELSEKLDVGISIHNDFTYEESHAKSSELTNPNIIYNKIKSKVDYGAIGYGLEVNSKVLGVVESKEVAENILKSIKEPYEKMLENEEANIMGISFIQDVEIVEVDTDFNELDNPEQLLKYLQRGTDEEKIHIVKEGDSFWSISHDYNLTVDDLISANPAINAALIHPGDEISLIIPKPYIEVKTTAKVIYEEKIDYETEYEYVSYLYNDEYRVKKKGVYGKAEVEAVVTKQNGIEIAKEILNEKVLSKPETRVILQGTKEPPPKKGTGYFINPLASGTITSRFGPRWGSYHHGLDIAQAQGTPIKAADGGTVIYAGWYGDYGYMIEIDHGGGFTTRYAHCSKLYVSVGEKVYQNKTIALVGHTGFTVGTSGNHVHFEVRKYGTPVNPQSYIGVQYR